MFCVKHCFDYINKKICECVLGHALKPQLMRRILLSISSQQKGFGNLSVSLRSHPAATI